MLILSLLISWANTKFPRFDFGYARRASEAAGAEAGVGRGQAEYSASFDIVNGKQDYNLQTIISSSAATSGSIPFFGKVGNKKLLIKKVFFKTPHAMWRFFGYYGGLNVVGNLHNYGQFSDTSTFELIPAWHNKAQAMAFEDAIYTRMSHWSYELRNNKLMLVGRL